MAWSHLYGTISSGGANALLPVIRDFMLSIGWELADDYTTANNPFLAMRSTGETGLTPHAVVIEKMVGYAVLIPSVCVTWETLAPYWTPGAGGTLVNNGTGLFTKGGTAPDFNTVFTTGDFIYVCNNTNNVNSNAGRLKVNVVGTTTMSYINSGYPSGGSIPSNANTILSKGGPFIHAKAYSTNPAYGRIDCGSATYYYYLFGDKDSVVVVTRVGTTYYGAQFGRFIPYHQEKTAITASELTSGVSTSVDVADGSLFSVGSRYQVGNGKNGHVFLITSIVGNTLNFTAGLTTGLAGIVYPVGTVIGEDIYPIAISGISHETGTSPNAKCPGDWGTVNMNDGGFNTDGVQGANCVYERFINTALHSAFNPDNRRGKYGFLPYWITGINDPRGQIRNVFRMVTQPGNSEDTIRLLSGSGDVYKIFGFTGGVWCVIKE